MVEKQVTTMVIKVDLGCEKCQKKIKKVLCKIHEIQNQIYDKKANTVTITVVCCCPEKIKKRICCKGGEAVKGIEIKVPEKEQKPIKIDKPIIEPNKQKDEKPETPKPENPGCSPYRRTCCKECYEGFDGGACYHGYGRPIPQCYVLYGRPVYDSWCGGGCSCRCRGYYVCRCEYVY